MPTYRAQAGGRRVFALLLAALVPALASAGPAMAASVTGTPPPAGVAQFLPDIRHAPMALELRPEDFLVRTDNEPAARPAGLTAPPAPLPSSALQAARAELSGARVVPHDAVQELVRGAAGIWLNRPLTDRPRHLLIMFSRASCVSCLVAKQQLAADAGRVPVLLMPVGRRPADLAACRGAMAGARVDENSAAASAVLRLRRASDFLARHAGPRPLVPAFLWVADGEARMGPLSSRARGMLLAALNQRMRDVETGTISKAVAR